MKITRISRDSSKNKQGCRQRNLGIHCDKIFLATNSRIIFFRILSIKIRELVSKKQNPAYAGLNNQPIKSENV
ncbi:hypothetical protein CFS9_23040 [Flavobacterium sp. CFS9]|uniref:Uncharacterized protein n=1 Tax=Flavobacterium sp. CFS9 TaxID=3143118 RepID=A0AAT9H1S3_9FLAO